MAPPWPVSIIFENLVAGMTVDEVPKWMEQFDVTREHVHVVLRIRGPQPRQNPCVGPCGGIILRHLSDGGLGGAR